eukprot:TRINITY_DN6161_c0_g1_i1.p1 TRINITY_DN6161_c0_g1~~TRINITY_DN6161_c0_g1_i1.p1  ORF type:complete len:723 (+),score=107.73 TRINITY_DN6161_c0_g1_i1:84-2171(+)
MVNSGAAFVPVEVVGDLARSHRTSHVPIASSSMIPAGVAIRGECQKHHPHVVGSSAHASLLAGLMCGAFAAARRFRPLVRQRKIPTGGCRHDTRFVCRAVALAKATGGQNADSLTADDSRAAGVESSVAVDAASTSSTSDAPTKTAIVVGGGVAGLATAGELANAGMRVTLLEKNAELGGRCQSRHSIDAKGYRWDTGPSLLLLPKKFEDAFSRLGSDIKQHLHLKRVDPAYRVVFGDDTFLDMEYDPLRMTAQMETIEPGCSSYYYQYLSMARRMLDMGVERFVDRQFESWAELVDPAGLFPSLLRRGWATLPLMNMVFSIDTLMKSYFKDERLRALFTFQTLYVGLTPYTSPGALCLLAGTDLTDGVWYPEGGWQGVTDSLAKLARNHGVEVKTDTAVDEIVVQDRRATGVKLVSGEVLSANVVVVNADLPTAYSELLRNADDVASGSDHLGGQQTLFDPPTVQESATNWREREFSCGVISFHWAVDKKVDLLKHHSVYLGCPVDTERSWKPITCAAEIPRNPNFYVHRPACTDPTAAPEGCDTITVLFPVANLQEMVKAGRIPPSGDVGGATPKKVGVYTEIRVAARAAVLRRLQESGVGKLEEHILEELVYDPEDWRELYGLQHGSTFGLSHGLLPRQGGLAMTRPPPRAAELDGLFFVGASTRPGNGVPLVLMGAGLTSKLILQEVGLDT